MQGGLGPQHLEQPRKGGRSPGSTSSPSGPTMSSLWTMVTPVLTPGAAAAGCLVASVAVPCMTGRAMMLVTTKPATITGLLDAKAAHAWTLGYKSQVRCIK